MILCADRVWTGVDRRPFEYGFVDVERGVIRSVGKASELAENVPRHDLGDVTLLPGLINSHVHLTFSASTTVVDDFLRERQAGTAVLTARAESNMLEALHAGVTTVRDLGGPNEVVLAAREAVRSGTLQGPSIVAAGEGITSPGGHCYFFGIEAAGIDAVRSAVRRQHSAGADLIKVFATGGHLTPGTDPFEPQFSEEELRRVVEEAREVGMAVSAHAHAPEGIARSVAAGVGTIEHCLFSTPHGIAFDERVVEQIASVGIRVVPTHGVSTSRLISDPSQIEAMPPARQVIARLIVEHLPEAFRNFRRMRDLGVELIAGSDAGITNRRFGDFPADLSVLANDAERGGIGLGPWETLCAATSGAARALGLTDRGTVQPGKRADLLAVRGDPFRNFGDLTNVALVMCGGRMVTPL